MATFLFLFEELGDYGLQLAVVEGSKVDNAEVKYIAKKLLHMFIGRSKWDLYQIPNLLKSTYLVSKSMSSS